MHHESAPIVAPTIGISPRKPDRHGEHRAYGTPTIFIMM